jgi:hypothetical protein
VVFSAGCHGESAHFRTLPQRAGNIAINSQFRNVNDSAAK